MGCGRPAMNGVLATLRAMSRTRQRRWVVALRHARSSQFGDILLRARYSPSIAAHPPCSDRWRHACAPSPRAGRCSFIAGAGRTQPLGGFLAARSGVERPNPRASFPSRIYEAQRPHLAEGSGSPRRCPSRRAARRSGWGCRACWWAGLGRSPSLMRKVAARRRRTEEAFGAGLRAPHARVDEYLFASAAQHEIRRAARLHSSPRTGARHTPTPACNA